MKLKVHLSQESEDYRDGTVIVEIPDGLTETEVEDFLGEYLDELAEHATWEEADGGYFSTSVEKWQEAADQTPSRLRLGKREGQPNPIERHHRRLSS